MKRVFKVILLVLLLIAVAAVCTWYVRTHSIAVFDAKGMIGIKEADLITTASLLMLIVVIPVYVLTCFFAWKYREGNTKARHAPDWEHNYIAEYCWWGVPLIIIVILAFIAIKSSYELNPFKPIERNKKPLTIQVIALEWKWLFIYPEQGIATVNYVQFPEQTPINFEITADAPMNSFWIPQLGGQIYAMPAMRSKLHLIADEAGTYRGLSANISGKGFAGMTFIAKSTTQEEFDQWTGSSKESVKTLNWNTYEQLVCPTENHPVTLYVLEQGDLFEQVLMKYLMPPKS